MAEIDETFGFYCLGDFRPEMPLVRGREALIHRLCVRLQTPRGRFPWWPNFGLDVAAFLLSKAPAPAVALAVESECLKDEQVSDARANAEFSADRRSMRLSVEIIDSAGPFTFTLSVEQAKLELIELQAS